MAERFEIRYDRWCGWLLGLLGMGRRSSGVEVTNDDGFGEDGFGGHVTIRMGWAFRLRAPLAAVVSAEPDDDRVWGWGVHGWRRAWLVNGSSSGLVRIRIDPAVRGTVVLVPCHIDTVRVSVEDRDRLIVALGAPTG